MSELTFGAVRDKLRANGYAPASVLSPLEKLVYRVADDPPGVLTLPNERERRLVSLIVTSRDQKLRDAIEAILEKFGLTGGPVRTDSSGAQHRPLRYDEYEPAFGQSWNPWGSPAGEDPAVIIEAASRTYDGQPLESRIIRVAGAWSKGDLLTKPRSKLPAIDRDGVARLFSALSALALSLPSEPYVNPPLPASPARPSVAQTRCRRDLVGQPALLRAHMEAVRRGEEVELPDEAPEDEAAA